MGLSQVLQSTNFIDPLIPQNTHNPQLTALPISTLTTLISFQDYISLCTINQYYSHCSSAYNNHQNSTYPVSLFLNGHVKVAVSNWMYKDRYQWDRKEVGIMVGTMLQMPQKQHLGYRGTVFSIDTEPTFFFSFESRADGTFKIVGLFHLKKEKELKKRQNKITHLTMNSEHD